MYVMIQIKIIRIINIDNMYHISSNLFYTFNPLGCEVNYGCKFVNY